MIGAVVIQWWSLTYHKGGLRSPEYDDTTAVVKRSIVISGHKTSVSAEAEFWSALKDITASQGCDISGLVTDIGKTRQAGKRSSAIRLFVLGTFKSARSRQPPAEPSLSAPTEILQVMLAIVQYEKNPGAGAYDQAD